MGALGLIKLNQPLTQDLGRVSPGLLLSFVKFFCSGKEGSFTLFIQAWSWPIFSFLAFSRRVGKVAMSWEDSSGETCLAHFAHHRVSSFQPTTWGPKHLPVARILRIVCHSGSWAGPSHTLSFPNSLTPYLVRHCSSLSLTLAFFFQIPALLNHK